MEEKQKNKKDYTGFPGDCNDEQIAALDKFQVYVYKTLGLPNQVYDEVYLLRFLRARQFDETKTNKMFNDFIEWRKVNNVDQIQQYIYVELPQVREFYPHGYHKTDKLGRPIYIERIGVLKLQQLFQITSEERLIQYYIQSYQTLLHRIFPACSKAKGNRVDQTLTILDLKGGSMKIFSGQVQQFVQLASKVAQDNYPEILGRMFIVNAPMLFSAIWTVIKVFLDQKTQSKITIIGSGYKEKLLEFVDEENLPDFLGGKSPCCDTGDEDILSQNIGPWNPNGTDPLFPGEPRPAKEEDLKQGEEDEQDEQDNSQQLANLKEMLVGMGVGGPVDKAPHNPNKYEMTTQGGQMVSDTPLNTQYGEQEEGGK